MNPQGLLGQLNQSMQSGQPTINQVSGTSPNFQPQLQPPTPVPTPNKSPAIMMHLHGALQRRGINPASIPQVMGQNAGNSPQMPSQPMPQPAPTPMQPSPAQQSMTMPKSEAELIIHALKDRLGLLGKHETAVRDAILPKKEEKEINGK